MARSPIRYERAAVVEIEQAIDWYRARDPRVAQRFIAAIRKTLTGIRAKPLAFPADKSGARCVRVAQFPYLVVYMIHRRTVVLVAFAHTSRDEDYWRARLR